MGHGVETYSIEIISSLDKVLFIEKNLMNNKIVVSMAEISFNGVIYSTEAVYMAMFETWNR